MAPPLRPPALQLLPGPPSPTAKPLPSPAVLEAETQALLQRRADAAFDRYQAAKKQTASIRAAADAHGVWPAPPEILHPDLQRSCRKRQLEVEHRLVAHHQRLDALWAAYGAQTAQNGLILQLLASVRPPPRLVLLVGGIEAFAQLPVLTLPLSNLRPVRLEALRPQDVPYPIMRGHDGEGRLFVSVVYQKHTGDQAPITGLITLGQAQADPASAWLTYNPQRFVPPQGPRGRLLTPTFPNMAGRSALAGGPDAQQMLGALTTLVQQGHLGPYTLGRGPGPSAPQRV